MRNLFAFIFRFHAFFLLLILETVCVGLMIQNNGFHRAAFLNFSDELVGKGYTAYNEVTDYLRLGEENRQLADENSRLKNVLPGSYYSDTSSVKTVRDTIRHTLYHYIPARVIQTSTNRLNNYIYINKGRDQGIAPRMAVIGPNGVVGIVKSVSDHFASLYSMLHSQVTVSARVMHQGSRGTIRWDGKSPYYVNLEEITSQEQLHHGDTIFTSGVSRLFPDNIPIGVVESFNLIEPGNFYEIRVKLSTDFKKLNYVYVVNNIMHEEMDSLINKTEDVR
jgi:rod shape-determining protein MreC